MEKYEPKVDDRVEVHHQGYRAGWTPAVVTRVGRTLVYIAEVWGADSDLHKGKEEAYYIATQQLRSQYMGSFRTPAQAAEQDTRAAAIQTLRSYGLDIRTGFDRDWSTEHLVHLTHEIRRIKS
jgi:hypothetical protein